MTLPCVPGLLERAGADVVKLCVHLVLAPEVLLQTLHPFEVRHDHTARVREHVGQDEDATLLERGTVNGVTRASSRMENPAGLPACHVLVSYYAIRPYVFECDLIVSAGGVEVLDSVQ